MIVDKKVMKGIKGVYLIDGVIDGPQLAVTKTPSKIRKFLIKLFLGWGFATVQELTKNK